MYAKIGGPKQHGGGCPFGFLLNQPPGAPFVIQISALSPNVLQNQGSSPNMVNVHFFLLRAFFPKPGWSVLQDDRSLNIQKERAEIKVQNERKFPQNERKYPQTSANLKNVTIPPSSGWKKGFGRAFFWGASVFWRVEQKSVIRAFFSRT